MRQKQGKNIIIVRVLKTFGSCRQFIGLWEVGIAITISQNMRNRAQHNF